MAGPQHRTPEYRAAYRQLVRDQKAGKHLTCVQGMYGSSGTCLHASRTITPTDEAHVAHDDTGTRIIGVAHAKCNRTDGAYRRQHGPDPHTPDPWLL